MNLEEQLANAIRFLSIDAVANANSGHPGMPMGMADIAAVLWLKFLKHNPNNPKWFNRDRFILSNGHGSMLQYALLHLTGYDLSIDDLKNFRQLNSKTPGHPENFETPGVETTTGPLGQGLANAVGMALAEKILASTFNKDNLSLIDHYTYAFVGDGCLMEGISHEASSLAGTLKLNKLIMFYDDNGISIDGEVQGWFSEDVKARFKAYNWHTIGPISGHDYQEIENAIIEAQAQKDKPTIIICKTIIGLGSNLQGTDKVHGAPLGKDDITAVRKHFNWPYEPFVIPDELYKKLSHKVKGNQDEQIWLKLVNQYTKHHPDDYKELTRRINQHLPQKWQEECKKFIKDCVNNHKNLATRKASQICLNKYGELLPELIGGSADLTSSNNTDWSGSVPVTAENFNANYIYYGVREFAMSAIMNGIALHGGFIPYGGTFLVFSDYAKNAIRLSALMKAQVIYVFTHDSVGLGEDGPTHQPIEQAAMLRMTPNMHVWRPACLVETAIAWQNAIDRQDGPSSLLLSRQTLPHLTITEEKIDDIKRGAYILKDSSNKPDVILIATGSELHLALKAAEQLKDINIRVISMPCVEVFLEQPKQYQDKILPPDIRKRIVIEASASAYWYRFAGLDGKIIGIERFGFSAPGQDALDALGFTVENIITKISNLEKQYAISCCD